MLISVTQDHIDRGYRKSSTECPVALAIKEAITVPAVVVGRYEIKLHAKSIGFLPPRSVQRFIRRLDSRHAVKPFKFRLDTTRLL